MSFFRHKTFRHGIHPPEHKTETSGLAIRQFPFAPLLIVPLSQHIGNPAVPNVREGQHVARGQRIADPDGFLSVAIHAPASGVIRRIAPSPTIRGKMERSIFLEPFAASTQESVHATPLAYESSTPKQILDAIQMAGIVGLGGAGFPTHAKLSVPEGKHVDTVVINGAECEPYLTTDHRVMLEHAAEVIDGIGYILRATGANRAVIAVEANKADAAATLNKSIPAGLPVTVETLPVKYPQGAEKMLIQSVLGREIPAGGLPIDVQAICVNVGTAAEVGKALSHGTGLQERVITISGPAVKQKGNYLVPIGTPLRFLLEVVGTAGEISTVVMGGPMMGTAASSLEIPVTKGSTGVIAFTDHESQWLRDRPEFPCIHCGSCLQACPLFLNPAQLGSLAEHGEYATMAKDHHLMDCFECGCCTFVCPANIPLVQRFRVAKAAVKRERRVAG